MLNKYWKLTFDISLYGKHYYDTVKHLKRLNSWNSEKTMEFVFSRVKALLKHAYLNVPYYQRVFEQVNFTPDNFHSLEDLHKIPFLTKEAIKENFDSLISKSVNRKYLKLVSSGGTTGSKPHEFYLDRRTSSPVELAHIQFLWKAFGYKFYDRCIVLRSDKPKVIEGQKYWDYNITSNWLNMSTNHLRRDTLKIYVDKIKAFKPKYIIAYPSAVYILSKLVHEKQITFPSVKGIICSSEMLYDEQRNYISDVFRVPVVSYYGLSEKCCIAGELNGSAKYTFIPTYGFVELINADNKWCKEEGEEGEIIATSLYNWTFPFIRYKTQDIGVNTNEIFRPGWKTLKKIKGRTQEYIVDKKGEHNTFTLSDGPLHDHIDKIDAYQFIQNEPGRIELNLEVCEMPSTEDLQMIKNEFGYYYPNYVLDIEIVDKIPRTGRGKFRYLIQNIKSDNRI